MPQAYVAIVIGLPDAFFPEGDEVCLTAGKHLAKQLENHLVGCGHTIPDWCKGGFEEDWGVLFQSKLGKEVFEYRLRYEGEQQDSPHYEMILEYGRQPSLCRSSFVGRQNLQTRAPYMAL